MDCQLVQLQYHGPREKCLLSDIVVYTILNIGAVVDRSVGFDGLAFVFTARLFLRLHYNL